MRKSVFLPSLAAAAVLYCLWIEISAADLIALLLPILIHELGHLTVLLLSGATIRGLRMEPHGLCIQYSGVLSEKAEIAAALSGAAAGLLYTLLIRCLKQYHSCHFLQMSADISLLLSVFNLLPVLPLDGGMALFHLAEILLDDHSAKRLCFVISVIFTGAVLLTGMILMLEGRGRALLAAGLWLMICLHENMGIVKNQKLL